MKKIYLAGPMRGYPEFNFPAFFEKAAMLRGMGYEVFNPAERDEKAFGKISTPSGDLVEFAKQVNLTPLEVRRNCFQADTDWICREADAIFLMKGWTQSKGARAEKALIEALDLEVIFDVDAETQEVIA